MRWPHYDNFINKIVGKIGLDFLDVAIIKVSLVLKFVQSLYVSNPKAAAHIVVDL